MSFLGLLYRFLTYLGVEAVAELRDAAGDLVKVHRLALAVAFHHIHTHGQQGDGSIQESVRGSSSLLGN